jgi:5-methylcytosine-specific restriction endonuclease McrA
MNRKYKKKYPEKIREWKKKYYEKLRKENPEKYKEIIRKSGVKRLKLRFQVLIRDRFTCQYCGKKAEATELQIDHIYPKSKGGKGNPENYITACKECNIGKSDVLLEEFIKT